MFVDDRRVGRIGFGGSTKKPAFGRSATFDGFGKGNHSVRIVLLRGTAFIDTFSY